MWRLACPNSPHDLVLPNHAQWSKTSFLRSLEDIASLKQRPGKDIYLMGGARVAIALIDAGLVDELRLIVYPLIAGPGKALFAAAAHRHKLELCKAQELGGGLVNLIYGIGKAAPGWSMSSATRAASSKGEWRPVLIVMCMALPVRSAVVVPSQVRAPISPIEPVRRLKLIGNHLAETDLCGQVNHLEAREPYGLVTVPLTCNMFAHRGSLVCGGRRLFRGSSGTGRRQYLL